MNTRLPLEGTYLLRTKEHVSPARRNIFPFYLIPFLRTYPLKKNAPACIYMRMQIVLVKAGLPDAQTISDMQKKSFQKLLETYRDYDTNPGAESIQKIIARMEQRETQYYFIRHNQMNVGAIRVVCMDGGTLCRISPIFILPEERNKGYAQETLRTVEGMYTPQKWILDTILEEKGNCYVYEKAGYRQTGEVKTLKEGMHLVHYEKTIV